MQDITDYHQCEKPLDWTGLYKGDSRFRKYLSPESFKHPAKMSLPLCEKILRHLEQLGLLTQGDTILDMMAGTARTGIIAELHRYPFIGIELEPHFIDLIEKNKVVLKSRIQREPDWTILQGDARKLSSLLSENGLVSLTSPPYADAETHPSIGGYDKDWGHTGKSITDRKGLKAQRGYSLNPSNIGNLKDSQGLVSLTSPPYTNVGNRADRKHQDGRIAENLKAGRTYDGGHNSGGNIASLLDKVALTSPPYEDAKTHPHGSKEEIIKDSITERRYGQSVDLFLKADTYLGAMSQIYREAFKVCKVIATVTKNPTKKGELRRLDIDTAKLLEMAGFEIVDYHRAILFEEKTQKLLTGGSRRETKGRLSFFKRLSKAKGNVVTNHEDILIAVSPMGIRSGSGDT